MDGTPLVSERVQRASELISQGEKIDKERRQPRGGGGWCKQGNERGRGHNGRDVVEEYHLC